MFSRFPLHETNKRCASLSRGVRIARFGAFARAKGSSEVEQEVEHSGHELAAELVAGDALEGEAEGYDA